MGFTRHFKGAGSTEKDRRLYNIWSCMRQRCNNPKHTAAKWYYYKGIRLCDEWESDFNAFQLWAIGNGYRNDLTIDRVDPDKGYEPDNCRWITLDENRKRARRQARKVLPNTKKKETVKVAKSIPIKEGRFMVVLLPEYGPYYFGKVIKTGLTKPEAGRYIETISDGKKWVRRRYFRYVTDGHKAGETVYLYGLRHYINE